MKLARYLKRENRSAREIADWCGVSASIVHRWIAGDVIPRGKHLLLIAEKTRNQVTPNDFYKIKSQGE